MYPAVMNPAALNFFCRNFAKRQLTWFRNEHIYHWLNASRPLVSHFYLSLFMLFNEVLLCNDYCRWLNNYAK